MENIVVIKNGKKEFEGNCVLNNINLELKKGNIYGFVGRNGSGKTMLFKAIIGLISLSEGEIIVNNKKIENGNIPDDIGIIIETPGFLNSLTGFENLKLLASIKGLITDEEIKKVLEKVELNPNDKRVVKKYSLGMKQRLGIIQALMENPSLLILDEPMNSLDEDSVELMRGILQEEKKKGTTILITSHNSEDINSLCDKIFKMESGRIYEIITKEL